MKREEIAIRDPFILYENNKYYMYGTRSETAWSEGNGFDVYRSYDLVSWEGPIRIFEKDENFWADKEFWAPECIKIGDRFYLFATLGSKSGKKGIQIFNSLSPDGRFFPLTDDIITPSDWGCIDASPFIDGNGKCWMIFSHSLHKEPRGAMLLAGLSDDLTHIDTEIKTLFYAKDAPWTRPIPFAKEEFGLDGENYFSDGPFLYYNSIEDRLEMLWSSWAETGYAMGVSYSKTGNIEGEWVHEKKPKFQGGGHGMIFSTESGKRYVTWHTPNDFLKERLYFMPLNQFMAGG